MGKLIIADNTVYEIDEECAKKKNYPADCDIQKWFLNSNKNNHTEERKGK